MPRASVIFATYNEKENIVPLTKAVLAELKKAGISGQVVIVDDNSPDGTAELAKREFRQNRAVKVVKRTERGLATALYRGIRESSGKVVVVMDADFSHEPRLVPKLVRLAEEHGVASGSRYVKGGGFRTKLHRSITTNLFTSYVKLMLGTRVSDYTMGFIAIRKDVLAKIEPGKVFYGYGDYSIRLFWQLRKKGIKVVEIPAFYAYRRAGQTKTKVLNMGLQYGISVLKLKLGLK